MYKVKSVSSLGKRPEAVNHLNGSSFQQDAICSFRGWQYAAIYLDHPHRPHTRHIHFLRRQISPFTSPWESFEFTDYDQTEDDGHNVISLGISPSDGVIHLVWDLHINPLNYRCSKIGVALLPERMEWSSDLFGGLEHTLPGLVMETKRWYTYPRFLSIPEKFGGGLILELRTGVAGLGDDYFYVYSERRWTARGMYLKGVENNAYINGIDISPSDGSLHVTWCYRDYVPVTIEQSRQQRGPNGPENNHDLHYAYSPIPTSDKLPGIEWYNAKNEHIGTSGVKPIRPESGGMVFEIPKFSGVMNQEAQCLAPDGIHVLNRETISGQPTWIHYHPSSGTRTPLPIPPATSLPPRGKLVYQRNRLLALLQTKNDLEILDLNTFEVLGTVEGAGGRGCQEVLYDRYREDVLSLFLCINGELVVADLIVQ